jgi:hypothetical protein
MLLLVCLPAASAAAAEEAEERPLARWSFERGTDEWQSRDCQIRQSEQKADQGGYSLRIAVDFPRPASVFRRVNLDIDLVSRIAYNVFVPDNAPENVKTLLFMKDKDGLWFQHFFEDSLQRGWNKVELDVSPASPHLRPSAHHRLWDSVAARGMNQIGVKFFCDDLYEGFLYLDNVRAYPAATAARPALRILNLRENRLQVGRFEKLEATFDVNCHVTNPFDPDHIKIDATFVDPKGKATRVPAFYYQDFVRRIRNDREELVAMGAGAWKVRFAPVTPGPHKYYLTVQYNPDPQAKGEPQRLITGERSFTCVPSASRGFVRVSRRDPFYFEFDNGEWFYPIGHNVHSPSDDTQRAVDIQKAIGSPILPDHGTFNYDYLFKKMADYGENLAEVWMCSWWLGIEWLKDWRNYNGLTRYNLHNAWKLDYLLDLAEKHDLYIHLVLDNHGKASSWTDPEWEDSPYNELNGGFLNSPEEYFRNPMAKEIYKKTLRYIVARWGYATRVMGLELWSEIDLVGDSWNFHADPVTAAPKVQWHREMTEYLEQIDPWDHIRTTHFSTTYSRIQPTLVTIPGIDYLATDAYSVPLIPLLLASAQSFNAYGKPGIVTEYGGAGPFGSHPTVLRAHLHAGLWATYMTHTAGTPLLWWFQFIESDDPQQGGLYWNFKALAAFHKGEERRGEGLVQRVPTFPSPHHDLTALALQNQRKAYVWVYSASSMERMPPAKSGPVFKGTSIQLSALNPGKYNVEVWDTYKGLVIAKSQIETQGSVLVIPLPEFHTDCALKVKPAP